MTVRVLFLGSAYHPLSVACLEALADTGAEVLVGRQIGGDGLRGALGRVWRARGGRAVARRALLVALARARLLARSLRIPLRGAASLAEVVLARGLEAIPYEDPNGPAFIGRVVDLGVELMVMANYPKRLRRRLFSIPRLGAINVHPSLLPTFRGPDPIYWIRASGVAQSGVTIHQVDDGFDTGPILLQRAFPIARSDSEQMILSRSIAVARSLLQDAIALILAGKAPAHPQNEQDASYFAAAPRGASAL